MYSSSRNVSSERTVNGDSLYSSSRTETILETSEVSSTKTVEEQLLEKGFTTENKVLVRGTNNSVQCQYALASSKSGDMVYVEMDTDAYVTTNGNYSTYVESYSAQSFPVDLRRTLLNCTQTDVCGVAIERSGEICTIQNSPTRTGPVEVVLHRVETDSLSRSIVEGDSVIAYPVVRCSEILSCEDIVELSRKIACAARRLRKASVETIKCRLDYTYECEEKMAESLKCAMKTVYSKILEVHESLCYLEDLRESYWCNPPCSSEGKEKYRLLKYNIVKRNVWLVELLRYANGLSDYQKIFIDAKCELDTLTDKIKCNYRDIDCVWTDNECGY
jgi:hypothetical protein